MKFTILGSGTSHGVPVIGCGCAVCRSSDPHDNRMRCSAFVSEPKHVVIDTGPEFRMQALRQNIKSLDAVLITHSHADHLNGLDDVRIFSHTKSVDPSHPEAKETGGKGLPVYANAVTIRDIHNRFDYIFMPVKEGGGKPKLDIQNVENFSADSPLCIGGLSIVPIPLLHGSLTVTGYVLSCIHPDGTKHSIAYLTDCSFISDESIETIKSCSGILEHAVIDGLRTEPHSTHFSFKQALSVAERILPRHTWLTHITHNMSHEEIKKYVNESLSEFPSLADVVRCGGSAGPAYDGLVLEA